jgi:lipopolysaccharide biosynthesis protein
LFVPARHVSNRRGGVRMKETPAMGESPIAVLVHVHYPEIWRDISGLLAERLRVPFRLIVTTSHPEDQIVVPKTPVLRSARILRVENRGRDILPFLQALAATDGFDLGLKLHTKKSPQRTDGAEWLAEILNSLLPSGTGVPKIIKRLRADRRIGFVAPDGFCLSVRPWVLLNAPGMLAVRHTLGASLTEDDLADTYFAAGSMFWFRRPALAALADPCVRALFEAEQGQFDGTIAHAMERLFPIEARCHGFLSLAMAALMSSKPAMSHAQLLGLARRHADVQTRFFPIDYIPTLPHIPPASYRDRIQPVWDQIAAACAGLRLTLSVLRGRA